MTDVADVLTEKARKERDVGELYAEAREAILLVVGMRYP